MLQENQSRLRTNAEEQAEDQPCEIQGRLDTDWKGELVDFRGGQVEGSKSREARSVVDFYGGQVEGQPWDNHTDKEKVAERVSLWTH